MVDANLSYSVIPAKAGIHWAAAVLVEEWIPAFAGMTTVGFARNPGEIFSRIIR
jgi:hypothetical protein